MDQLKNPFSPGAGTPPPELAGRDDLLGEARIALERIKAGKYAQSMTLVGLRGVGKTVLLNKIREMATEIGYSVVMIEATESRNLPELILPSLRQTLFKLDAMADVSERVKRGLRVFRSFISRFTVKVKDIEFGLNIDPEKGTADSGDLETDLPELLIAIGDAAKDRNTALAIIIDEMQYLSEKEISALVMSIHLISQRQLPVVLIGAGLPQLIGLAGSSKSYAERLFRYYDIGPLSEPEAIKALQIPVLAQGVRFTDEALRELVRITCGYPYFLQEWGYSVWNVATDSPITIEDVKNATALVTKKLDEGFFRVRFDRLTQKEKEYMRAMADLGEGPHRSGDVANRLGVKVQSVAPVRSGLIRKGMIYSPAHGDTAFTVPLFNEFMLRTMPDATYS